MKLVRKLGGLEIVALSATAAFLLAGCASTETAEPSDPAPATDEGASSEEASDPYELTFIQGVAGDEFYISMRCGIEEAAEAAGATVTTQGPEQFDPTLQKPIVDATVSAAPDALLIAPTDVTAMFGPIQAAADAGIEVVFVDTSLEDSTMAASKVASDNFGGGVAAFEAIEEANPEGGKVLVVSVKPGISTTDARAAGFESAVDENPLFESIGIEYSENEPRKAAQIVTAALEANPDLIGIFAANLFAAEGSATGLQQSGKTGEVTIVGFDAGPAQVEALRDGIVDALVAQQPATIGKAGVEQAIAALNGESVESEIQTGFTTLTAENIDGDGADAVYVSSCE